MRQHLRLPGVPVFMYHRLTAAGEGVATGPESKYAIRGSRFREQLALIADEGVRTYLIRELWEAPRPLADAGRVAIATFDDGQASDYEVAYPALVAAGARAEFFINTATIGQPGYLDWPHVIEMHRAGMSFQSHSHDHVRLLGLSTRTLEHQLIESKRRLEDRLGAPVDVLAAPYGLLNQRVVNTALRVGYRAVCNSYAWPAQPGASTVNRIPLYGTTTMREFLRLLHGSPLPFARRLARAALIYVPKQLLLSVAPGRRGVRVLKTNA